MKNIHFALLLFIPLMACQKDHSPTEPTPPAPTSMYFPPNNSTVWETTSVSSLGWNANAVTPLLNYLKDKYSKSFMILVNGRIVIEEYFNGQTASDPWEWNSAGKTLVSQTVGIAQQEGLLNINDKVSKYLGMGWSSEPTEKENLITIRNLMTMTSGLNDESDLVIKSNLTYLADAGTRWSYSNVFKLLMDVVEKAANQKFEDYFNAKIKNKIGMDGLWNNGILFRIYHSNARSMARFGLLALNNGMWNGGQVINEDYVKQSTSTSQNINPSYGYLCWLNGKTSYMVPGSQHQFNGYLVPNAPLDMYSAMGAHDERIYIVPSKKMVVIRMGDASDPDHPSFAVSGFDTALWEKINALIN